MRISIFLCSFWAPLSSSMGTATRPGEGFAREYTAVRFALARWGLGARFVWLLLPLYFWPVGGRGRSRRATVSSARAPVGSDARGSDLAQAAIGRCRDGRSECDLVPLRSQVPTDSSAGLAGMGSFGAQAVSFWQVGPHIKAERCRKTSPGLVGAPIEQTRLSKDSNLRATVRSSEPITRWCLGFCVVEMRIRTVRWVRLNASQHGG